MRSIIVRNLAIGGVDVVSKCDIRSFYFSFDLHKGTIICTQAGRRVIVYIPTEERMKCPYLKDYHAL